MSVVEVEKISHKEPFNFRVRYEDAQQVLEQDVEKSIKPSNEPPLESESGVTVVGAGFGGLASSVRLNKLGIEDFVVFDKYEKFGGTWYANTYPGCASDIPALWYSLYDELNTSWSEIQPPQYELEEYILKIVEKYQLMKKARMQTVVERTVYSEKDGKWTLTGRHLKDGRRFKHTSKVVLMCVGGLVYPKQLEAPGLENYSGTYMHSAIWNHNISFKDKEVVVVGNGCSACQVVPALLKDYSPKKVTQIARSKQHFVPPLPKIVMWLYNLLSFCRLGLVFVRMLVASISEARFPLYRGDGCLARAVRWINTLIANTYLKNTCPPEYYDILKPDFKFGCKRLILDDNYLPSLHDERITVVDKGIKRVEEDTVILSDDTEVKADIIVACTGYDLSKSLSGKGIYGRGGFDLHKFWAENGASAYQTCLAKNCPNLFFVAGPNSITGHSSVVLAIENGCNYFSKFVPQILSGEYNSVCVKDEVYDKWFDTIQQDLKNCVFGSEFGGCTSWYSSNGVNSTTFPYSQIYYWWTMSHPRMSDLEIQKNKQD